MRTAGMDAAPASSGAHHPTVMNSLRARPFLVNRRGEPLLRSAEVCSKLDASFLPPPWS
jgi:hypothetical protein